MKIPYAGPPNKFSSNVRAVRVAGTFVIGCFAAVPYVKNSPFAILACVFMAFASVLITLYLTKSVSMQKETPPQPEPTQPIIPFISTEQMGINNQTEITAESQTAGQPELLIVDLRQGRSSPQRNHLQTMALVMLMIPGCLKKKETLKQSSIVSDNVSGDDDDGPIIIHIINGDVPEHKDENVQHSRLSKNDFTDMYGTCKVVLPEESTDLLRRNRQINKWGQDFDDHSRIDTLCLN